MSHPLAKLWPKIAAEIERAPETVILPRDEITRFGKMMYFLGLANATLGMSTVTLMTIEDDNKDLIRANYLSATADWVKSHEHLGTFEQMLATMRAHQISVDGLTLAVSEVHSGDHGEGRKIAEAIITHIQKARQ